MIFFVVNLFLELDSNANSTQKIEKHVRFVVLLSDFDRFASNKIKDYCTIAIFFKHSALTIFEMNRRSDSFHIVNSVTNKSMSIALVISHMSR